MASEACPCGLGMPLANCCGRYLDGPALAPTAEALMRSRYTAYTLGREGYLLASWHATTRPASIDAAAGPEWLGLEVIDCRGGAQGEAVGEVEFRARYRDRGQPGALHERSRFCSEAGQWFYLDGTLFPPTDVPQAGRNAPCPCGSGKKYKRCCASR